MYHCKKITPLTSHKESWKVLKSRANRKWSRPQNCPDVRIFFYFHFHKIHRHQTWPILVLELRMFLGVILRLWYELSSASLTMVLVNIVIIHCIVSYTSTWWPSRVNKIIVIAWGLIRNLMYINIKTVLIVWNVK